MSLAGQLTQQALLRLDPETAHQITIRALAAGLHPRTATSQDQRLSMRFWGLHFSNPLGMAAGFDKNAEAYNALLKMGFGFTEVGTLTPEPQVGNPRPRLFRLKEDQAVINRMGFNNCGHESAYARLKKSPPQGVVGINIGANKDSEDRISDYVAGIKKFSDIASYFTVNISSPNTPGLRDLQARNALDSLLARLIEAREQLPQSHKRPLILKIAPDLTQSDMDDISHVVISRHIDGVIVSNTTLSREGLKSEQAKESGGLSGEPLFKISTRALANMYVRLEGKLPLIGAGGVHNVHTLWSKIEAGASLVQLYTGLVYEGPCLLDKLKTGLLQQLQASGHATLSQAVGTKASSWAATWES